MKLSFIKLFIVLAIASVSLTACDNNEDILSSGTESSVPEGYFRATFFPQAAGGNELTRAAIDDNSERIQSLVCMIYQKQKDGSYQFFTEDNIIEYDGFEGNINAQTYKWPLQKAVSYDLPIGDYKAVFLGNVDPRLFENQKDNAIVTNYTGEFGDARINMPEEGPLGFNEYNMFYLAAVDFSAVNPDPYVILQRLVSNNVYSREAIDDNEMLNMLVDNIVKEIRENQLTTELVHDLLQAKILKVLQPIEGLTGILTGVVDRLVNILLGDVLEWLNQTLLEEVLTRLEASLKGDGGASNSLLGLNYILNPWSTVNTVDVTFESLPRSINFNRECKSYFPETTYTELPITKEKMDNGGVGDYDDVYRVSLITLNGDTKLKSINVDTEKFLLASLLSTLDEKALNGLLVNIHTPLGYATNSNLQYKTPYELLNLTLSDFSADESSESLALNVKLSEIVNLEELVKQLLGDNLISGLVGGLTNSLVQPLLKALDEVVIGDLLDIKLPGLNLNNIVIEGGWDATHVSDGSIAAPLK